jgi:alanine racemase
MKRLKTWVEIDRSALRHNLKAVSKLVKPAKTMAVIKSNAYGHGLVEVALAVRSQADWFGVDSIDEALTLRKIGIRQPILILGFTRADRVKEAVNASVSFVAYDVATLKAASLAGTIRCPARIHLKLETGLTRQGIQENDLQRILTFLQKTKTVQVEGASTHFANIEDTEDDAYAMKQLKRYEQLLRILKVYGYEPLVKHTACSAAAILYPSTRFDLIRLGISLYGLWSSDRTELAKERSGIKLTLKSSLTWKTIVSQVKSVPKGTSVSYGLTEYTKRDSKIAVLPIGYWDGFDRVGMSRKGEVLVRGKRCKILGRVCMNMCMADVTDVPGVQAEDEVVLIGKQGSEVITAESMANKADTINYEIVTRINPLIPRLVV